MDEKSRARDGLERGESNVRAKKNGDAMSERAGAVVGPVVLGNGADEARVFVW